MRKMTYLAVFEPIGNGAYSIYFPNVLGCVSYGKNFQEAQAMAQEALELHILRNKWIIGEPEQIVPYHII